MGLSIAELESQSSECLPAREVMTLLGGAPKGSCVATNDATTQDSSGLIALNVDADNAGIANGNTVGLCDFLNDNAILNEVLNGNLSGNG